MALSPLAQKIAQKIDGQIVESADKKETLEKGQQLRLQLPAEFGFNVHSMLAEDIFYELEGYFDQQGVVAQIGAEIGTTGHAQINLVLQKK